MKGLEAQAKFPPGGREISLATRGKGGGGLAPRNPEKSVLELSHGSGKLDPQF